MALQFAHSPESDPQFKITTESNEGTTFGAHSKTEILNEASPINENLHLESTSFSRDENPRESQLNRSQSKKP
jgi:hypothetical protein